MKVKTTSIGSRPPLLLPLPGAARSPLSAPVACARSSQFEAFNYACLAPPRKNFKFRALFAKNVRPGKWPLTIHS
jgi:hypothetical protein